MKPLDPMTFRERVWLYTYAPVMVLLSVLIEEEESELGSDAWPPSWRPPRKRSLRHRIAVRLKLLADPDRRVRCCPTCDAERRQP
jgi:hypothetical protein